MCKGSDSATAASTAVQVWTNVDYPVYVAVHRMQGGAGQELPSSEAAPPRNIKYEFGMKNEDYHNRCPSYHLLTKPPGCNLIR